jgi:prolyl 4-hydroxylase
MYLNEVEAGGGTRFTDLDMTVVPQVRPAIRSYTLQLCILTILFPGHFQVGRVLIWPSVYDSDPMNKDPRLTHEALPVEAGIKYGANGWIHMYDYLGPQSRGCN